MKRYLLATTLILASTAFVRADVVVMSWGGDYGAAQIAAFNRPFTEQTGIESSMVDSDNPNSLIKSMVEANNVTVDVVEVEYPDAIRGCGEGILTPIDPSILPAAADGTTASKDFIEGSITECGVGTIIYSSAFAYDNTKFAEGPKVIGDFFDVKKFPGKRAVRKQPKFALETALMADGVPAAEVYKVLATPEGVDRAFAKLDTIKSEIIWYEANAQAIQLLADGEVSMAEAPANRFFNAAVAEGKPFTTVWDGQLYDFAMFVIPKGAPHLADAMKYMAFATDTKQLAALSTELPFGPARRSSVALVHYYKDGKTDIRPYMPTNPDNLKNSVAVSSEFWADHDAELTERFNAWLTKN